MAQTKMPVLFIGHGSPMNAIGGNEFSKALTKLGKALPRPKAILVVSAHWLTSSTLITSNQKPKTIHDFYGFPAELYGIQYPAKGSPELAKEIADSAGRDISPASSWGLDHASWAVLRHMYPNAGIPVLELSVAYEEAPEYHYKLARKLAPLRDEGILIIGSGNIVHNLWKMDPSPGAKPFKWATEFDEKVKECLLKKDHGPLINYEKLGEAASLSVPTNDHYLPMLYPIGLQEKGEGVTFFFEGIQGGSVSMRGFSIS